MTSAVVSPPTVCLIIVTYNSADDLERCLGCVAAQTRLPDRLILIDNDSRDGSAQVAARVLAGLSVLRGRFTILRAATNLGFAAANNLGIRAAAADLVALLNPDAFPEPEWLAALVAAADLHPDAAAFGSLQMMDGHPGVIDGCGDVYHVTGLSWRSGHGRALRPADLLGREIFSACAAAALYRRKDVLAVGAFDEDFFCYMEDVDLGFRLRLAGHTARGVPAAVVQHAGCRSSGGRRGSFAIYHGHRNLVWCYVKNMPQPLFTAFLIPHLAQTTLVFVVLMLRGQGLVFLRAKCDALRSLGVFLRRRGETQLPPRRKVSWWQVWRTLEAGMWRW